MRSLGAGLVAAAVVFVAGCSGSSGPHATSGSPSTLGSASPESASKLAPIHGRYSPVVDPAAFVRVIDNRYWPLIPGTGFHYRGVRGTTAQTDDEIVLRKTTLIQGVACTAVRDTVSEHGRAVERTIDWYAQDREGNVWYMGELSLERRHGRMARASDSWKSGVHGGQPGIIMPAAPPRSRVRPIGRSTTRPARLSTRHVS